MTHSISSAVNSLMSSRSESLSAARLTPANGFSTGHLFYTKFMPAGFVDKQQQTDKSRQAQRGERSHVVSAHQATCAGKSHILYCKSVHCWNVLMLLHSDIVLKTGLCPNRDVTFKHSTSSLIHIQLTMTASLNPSLYDTIVQKLHKEHFVSCWLKLIRF